MPPGCCEMCRGSPAISVRARQRARQRGDASFVRSVRAAMPAPRPRAAHSTRRRAARAARGRRMASQAPCRRHGLRRAKRSVAKVATSAACSRPYFSVTPTMSFSRISRGKSRSISGTDASSRLRKRPSERLVARPGRHARGRSDSKRANPTEEPRPRPGGSTCRMEPGPRTSFATFACKLEHLPSAGGRSGRVPSSLDQHELFLEPLANTLLVAVNIPGRARRCVPRRPTQLHDRRLRPVGEVGIAVAELFRQVEPQAVGELDRARNRSAVVGKALDHVPQARRERTRGCRAVRARTRRATCGSERQRGRPEASSARVMRVDIAGRDRLHLQHLREIA